MSQRGVSLYLALAIMTLLLGIALGISAILFGQMRTIRSVGYSVVAFYAADTGMERELKGKNYQNKPAGYTYADYLDINGNGGGISCSPPCQDACPGTLVDLDDACYQVTISSISPIIIRSFGYYQDVRRAIEISF